MRALVIFHLYKGSKLVKSVHETVAVEARGDSYLDEKIDAAQHGMMNHLFMRGDISLSEHTLVLHNVVIL